METQKLQLTPEQRQALQDRPGEPIHIQDAQTHKVYLLIEQGSVPTLEEGYIRQGLEMARQQIAEGKVSSRSMADVIAEAERRHAAEL